MAKIAILTDKEFEDSELMYPRLRLLEAGHQPVLISHSEGEYTGKKGQTVKADTTYDQVQSSKEFDGVIVPGGWSPDHMRRNKKAIAFLKEFSDGMRPVGAICHGGWALASAGLVKGKNVTSFHSIQDDLKNAGAEWTDREVVVDGNLITSRIPDDLPAFMRKFLELFSS